MASKLNIKAVELAYDVERFKLFMEKENYDHDTIETKVMELVNSAGFNLSR